MVQSRNSITTVRNCTLKRVFPWYKKINGTGWQVEAESSETADHAQAEVPPPCPTSGMWVTCGLMGVLWLQLPQLQPPWPKQWRDRNSANSGKGWGLFHRCHKILLHFCTNRLTQLALWNRYLKIVSHSVVKLCKQGQDWLKAERIPL